jgi:hypothetical protein
MKKAVLHFVSDGFADWQASHALVGIRKSDCYTVKTIALEKECVLSMSGMQVLPDLDFIPVVDLKDIDRNTTAMLILPGGDFWNRGRMEDIKLLVWHCLHHEIPIAAIGNAVIFLDQLKVEVSSDHSIFAFDVLLSAGLYQDSSLCSKSGLIVAATETAGIEFAKTIFEVLGIENNFHTVEWFQNFEKLDWLKS